MSPSRDRTHARSTRNGGPRTVRAFAGGCLWPAVILTVLLHGTAAAQLSRHRLRVATVNMWSGLTYVGFWKMGEYETEAHRAARFDVLVEQLRALDPDVLFLQEVNPVAGTTRRLARALGMESIHQVKNAGIKFGPIGVPTNLKEGIAILARPDLRLEEYGAWKLSGGFGLHGDALSFHFDEANFMLAGTIVADGIPLLLLNTHFSSRPPWTDAVRDTLARWLRDRTITPDAHAAAVRVLTEGRERKLREAAKAREIVDRLPRDIPVIFGGDLNAAPGSEELRLLTAGGRLNDPWASASDGGPVTWDPERNTNLPPQWDHDYPSLSPAEPLAVLRSRYDRTPVRLDYILPDDHFLPANLLRADLVCDVPLRGTFASDHYGFTIDLPLDSLAGPTRRERNGVEESDRIAWDALPIAMYDTDIGFGYGAKGKAVNTLGWNESFDLILFNSTKGERWYRFAASFPDAELRQGRIFPLAVDATVDYDKMIRGSFFGIGSGSRFEDREFYTREPLDVTVTVSRAFSRQVVVCMGATWKAIRNFRFEPGSRLALLPPESNAGTVRYTSLNAGLRYDTRNSILQPTHGYVLDAQAQAAAWSTAGAWVRVAATAQWYGTLFYPTTVLALRLTGSTLYGGEMPVQLLQSLGGNRLLRGSPQDRYLDRTSMLCNAELRFPIWWRFGGILGCDAGKVWNAPGKIDLARWAANSVIGLRFAMDTFLVRLDVGLGRETNGFYFNFDHIY
jgi:endonuclease/exonuclease/phosphatase family metal-dependent hydrolase